MSSVAVIDYGMGNLRSVSKAVERVADKTRVKVTRDPQQIRAADRVIIPGVGAVRDCMHELRRLHLDAVIIQCASEKPFLGICLGMQALLEFSEENQGVSCFGLLPGRVRRLDTTKGHYKIPHMGWNQVRQVRAHPLWDGIPPDSRFYFVHSYYPVPNDPSLTAGRTDYTAPFSSALTRDNLFAVQFHPEKSQNCGLQLLANFLKWDGKS